MAEPGPLQAAAPVEAVENSRDVSAELEQIEEALTIAWMFLNAVFVFLMQLGFAMLEVGSVRIFHVQNILIKNVVDGAITIVAWFAFAYAFYGNSGNGFSGKNHFFMIGADDDPLLMATWFLGVTFAASAVTIVSGAMAERCKLPAYFAFSAIMAGFVYPLAGHWVWSTTGWISPYNDSKLISGVLGYLDYSGSSMVHALGGMAALIAVFVLGPRHGRFGIDGEVVELEGTVGNSGVYKVMGTMMLFVSFLSFNASSVQNWERIAVAGLSGTNTMIAASTSAFAVMMWKTLVNRFEMNVVHSIDGILAGCVSVTAGSTLIHPWAAAVVGAFGGILYVQTSDLMLRFQLDDVVNAVAIHLTPGIWGCFAVGLFATEAHIRRAYPDSSFEPGVEYDVGVAYGGNGKLLGMQVLGLVVLMTWCVIIVLPLFLVLRQLKVLRIPTDAQISVHSGFKSHETYSWNRYPQKIISLNGVGTTAEAAQSGARARPSASSAPPQSSATNGHV
eukprot:jgi/Ulvmu1/9858/UM057_0012.1